MKQFILNNNKHFIKVLANVATFIFGLYSIIFTFISWSDISCNISILTRLFVLLLTIVIIIAITFFIVYIQKKNVVWVNGTGKLNFQYGDLMEIAFNSRTNNQKIVVIPVNTHFDTILDESPNIDKPLVSPTTIHGMWLKRYCKYKNPTDLNKEIQTYLEKENSSFKLDSNRTRGNTKRFDIGTIAKVAGENGVTFFLLAISDFDDNNNAHTDEKNIQIALQKLLEFNNRCGNGFELYLPLIGTGCSRAGLSHKESLNTIYYTFMLDKNKIYQEINVIIYHKDRDKVSIWQNQES